MSAKNQPISETEFRDLVGGLIPPKTKIVVSHVSYPDPTDDNYIPGDVAKPHVKKLDRDGMIEECVEAYQQDDVPKLPATLGNIMTLIANHNGADSEWGNAWVETRKQYKKRREEEERKACEQLASRICTKYNVKANTFDFIRAVHRHYNSISRAERHFRDDGEMRAERYARCLANGNTAGFFSDNDYSTSKINEAEGDLGRLMRYLHRYCPLLMASFNEARKRKTS